MTPTRTLLTITALLAAGAASTGSAVHTGDQVLAAAPVVAAPQIDSATVGVAAGTPNPARPLRAARAAEPAVASRAPAVQEVSMPANIGTLGIPEIALAAYRNAELAMQAAQPNCGVTWHLLAGIGRIESGHASGGRTDEAGTTVTPILGPVLDGTLPGNEIIVLHKAAAGTTYARAIGPMQFLPSTWQHYASDGNGDGVQDPNNVFDAALGAAKYLCSGNLDLRDAAQERSAVLRYNNSVSYLQDVLSWSAAYSTGGAPVAPPVPVDLLTGPDPTVVASPEPPAATGVPLVDEPPALEPPKPPPPPMIEIPGLPPIPCGILCPIAAPLHVGP